MRAFVTGGSGFIGSHLVQDLLLRAWRVRALVHRTPLPSRPGLETVQGNILDLGFLKKNFEDTDIVFHLASALGSSLIPPEEFFRVNARGTEIVLRAAREAGVRRVLHFSSAGVLGHVKGGEAAGENHPPDPRDIYDRSKLEGERAAQKAAGEGLDVVIVRPGWVYGPGDRRTFKLIRSIARGRFLMVSQGRTLQTPVHIQDLLDGTRLCLEKGRKGEIYHLAGPEVLTVREIVEAIARASGRSVPRLRLPLLPTKAAAWVLGKAFALFGKEAPLTPSRLAFFIHPKPLSIRKAQRELGFVPAIPFEKGIETVLLWYRENGWL